VLAHRKNSTLGISINNGYERKAFLRTARQPLLLFLSQSYSRPAAVLSNELDAGLLQSSYAMLKAVNAREFDMVAAWSVDRLGRSLTDLLSILQGMYDKGVDLFLHQQGLDTSTTAWQGDVSDAWRVRPVRAGHHSGACQRWAREGEGPGARSLDVAG
jgi:hypothetical protein